MADERVRRMEGEGADEVNGSNALSAHDRAVLSIVFNPMLPTDNDDDDDDDDDDGAIQMDSYDNDDDDSLTNAEHSTSSDAERDAQMRRRQRQMEIEALEAEGVRAVEEEGDPRLAAELFSKVIAMDDSRAAAYNNRAQAFRLLANIQGAESDLDKAIELSRGRGRVACQAYTQRALLRKLQGKVDQALDDFEKAAALGSQFSKAQVASMNPYAAMCNTMLTEMMEKMRRGEIDH